MHLYALSYMLWPLRGLKTIITLWDCRKRFLHFQLNIIFVGSPQFYRHSCQSPSILLICCLLLLLHVLLSSFLTFSVVCGSGSPSQLWLQESLKRCQGLAAFYCECWHVFLLVGEWSRFIFEPKPPFLPGVWPKSPAGWRGAISPLVGEPQLVRQKVAEKFSLYTLQKLRWLAGKSTMNEDVFSTENGRFASQSC